MTSFAPLKNTRSLIRTVRFSALATAVLAGFETELRRAPQHADEIRTRYKRLLGRGALSTLDVRWSYDGPLPRVGRGTLVVSNHRSALDIAIYLGLFDASILSRGDLVDWPVLGRLAAQGRTIFVDRKDRSSGARAIRQIRAALQRRELVCVFPEGTTLAGDDVRPFQHGAFAAARGLDVEIVPVGFAYSAGAEYTQPTFLGHLSAIAARPWTRVHVCFGEAERMTGSTHHASEHFRDAVQTLVDRARKRLDGGSGARST